MNRPGYDVAIVGGGIVGLAHAYVFAKAGHRVAVFERNARAVGASIRNFGMIWPIGQPLGEMRELALTSRSLWLEVLREARIWHRECGSLHLAYREDELAVLEEFASVASGDPFACEMISSLDAAERSPEIRREGLAGALWSPSELCVFPREIVRKLPEFLSEKYGVEFYFDHAVSSVDTGRLSGGGKEFRAEQIVVCPGDDLGSLFPRVLQSFGLKLCKLQMLRAKPKAAEFDLGPHLCAGLTLAHYQNFRACRSLEPLLDRFASEYPEHMKWGVHLLVSQHADGCLTIGDSHEYGPVADPFLNQEIDDLILGYLDTFLPIEGLEVVERWHGVYAKHPTKPFIIESPCEGVKVVAGLGGAGMTLSFGVATQFKAQQDAALRINASNLLPSNSDSDSTLPRDRVFSLGAEEDRWS